MQDIGHTVHQLRTTAPSLDHLAPRPLRLVNHDLPEGSLDVLTIKDRKGDHGVQRRGCGRRQLGNLA